jgi:hypothetical protein
MAKAEAAEIKGQAEVNVAELIIEAKAIEQN